MTLQMLEKVLGVSQAEDSKSQKAWLPKTGKYLKESVAGE